MVKWFPDKRGLATGYGMDAHPSKLRDVTGQPSATTVIAEIRDWMDSLKSGED